MLPKIYVSLRFIHVKATITARCFILTLTEQVNTAFCRWHNSAPSELYYLDKYASYEKLNENQVGPIHKFSPLIKFKSICLRRK